MAAYAALVSLMTTLNNIQSHPRVSTFFDQKQIQSLHQIIYFLLDFIESSNSHGDGIEEEEFLESFIVSTTHGAEDVIESHVVKQILADAQKKKFEASNLIGRFRRQVTKCAGYFTDCLLNLEKEIEHMNYVKEMVMEFQGAMKFEDEQSSRSTSAASSKPLTTAKKDFVVGFDEKVIQIMERLTAHQPDLQIVPIVGMGGIGKTTLAKSVYHNLFVVERFDMCAWVTISQEYSVKKVLFELLSCVGASVYFRDLETDEDHELGLKLYQTLSGRRYLIVLDDIWSLEAWDKIRFYFPENGQKSRVVITTRIWSVATHLSSSSFEMSFLDEHQSWELFCENVFLEKGRPPELEEIGKEIVRACKGLPLSIVVTGGLLRNSKITHEYWVSFARDLNSNLISGNDEHCLNILSLSYNHLPAHLKPCFLYMGVFPEDAKIHASQLINYFVAEGFLKPKEGQTLEEVAEDYLNDMVDRNLILVDSWKRNGRVKYCKIHDLVRQICLKTGERENIFHRIRMIDIIRERRIVFDGRIPKKKNWPFGLPSASLARTFLCEESPLPFKFRLVRVLSCVGFESHEDISQHVNLRYLKWRLYPHQAIHSLNVFNYAFHSKLPSSISLLWNVHTLFHSGFNGRVEAPSEIWNMRQLRHLQSYRLILPDPPPSEQQDDALLPNLQTLSTVVNLSFTEQVCKRIPNIKKLGVEYTDLFGEECQKKCCDFGHLHKLQSLSCSFVVPRRDDFLKNLVFPSSLRRLSLISCRLHWEDLNKIGLSLPHLESLKLYRRSIVGPEWDCVEGAFPCLKFLQIRHVDLIKWRAESSDFFPALEKLHLDNLEELERIPSGMGEIYTLGSLRLHYCSMSAAISSIEILEEQLSFGNDDLQLLVHLSSDSEEEKKSFMEKVEINSFTTKNFEFHIVNNNGDINRLRRRC